MAQQYLVWNIKNEAWHMSDMIGYTDEGEFAGLFTREYLERNTGIYNTRTGDYAYNIIVNASNCNIEDFDTKVRPLPKTTKAEFKAAVMKERKRRGLPIELIIKGEERYCPYCKKQLIKVKRVLDKQFCGRCNNPFTEIEEW